MREVLKGKVALVTGGARGIGAAVVRRLAEEGAEVAFSYGTSADAAETLVSELQGKGLRAAAFKADQADAAQVGDLVKSVVAEFGGLDILVNNAGLALFNSPVDDPNFDTAGLDRLIAVNIGGVVAGVRAAAKVIREGGRIITIGSTAASVVRFPGLADYAGSKAAVTGFTRGWARDLGAKKVTVNTIQPGPIFIEGVTPTGEALAALTQQLAVGRLGDPSEVAALVAFLSGPEAGYITGASLAIDGGYTI